MGEKIERVPARTESGSYEILIGTSTLEHLVGHPGLEKIEHIACVVSNRVLNLHGEYIRENLARLAPFKLYAMDDSEENKNYRYAGEFLEMMIEGGGARRSAVLGIGGGVVGDFAGFLASIYMRGIPVIHVPTTLLAMVDSSIGGKVAVNLSRGKNIAGSFHQPLLVIDDIIFIGTLPEKEFLNGVTEALKHGLIGDAETLNILEKNDIESLKNNRTLARLVLFSVVFKSSIVEKDERESGLREVLNFGHTVAHGIESFYGYKGVSHGEAVAAGMLIESEISRQLGLLPDRDYVKIKKLIEKFGIGDKIFHFEPDELLSHMMYDKKNISGTIRFTLLNGIGNPVTGRHVDEKLLLHIIKEASAGSI